METLTDIKDGVAPFPRAGERVMDTEWGDEAEYGTVEWAEYPEYRVVWDDNTISTERVVY